MNERERFEEVLIGLTKSYNIPLKGEGIIVKYPELLFSEVLAFYRAIGGRMEIEECKRIFTNFFEKRGIKLGHYRKEVIEGARKAEYRHKKVLGDDY